MQASDALACSLFSHPSSYETTSSEESSEEDNAEDSSEPEEEGGGRPRTRRRRRRGRGDMAVPEVMTAEEPACEEAQAAGPDCDTVAPETGSDLQEEQPGG